MPGYLLHQGAMIQCMHAGQAQPTITSLRVKVSGQPIVTQPGIYSITGCPLNISGAPVPCVTAQWTSAAKRVKSDGMPVLLQDSIAVCIPNGTGVLVMSTQTRVRGI